MQHQVCNSPNASTGFVYTCEERDCPKHGKRNQEWEGKTYRIVRYYAPHLKKENKVIDTGLPLSDVQRYCNDPSTHVEGQYFDGYEEE